MRRAAAVATFAVLAPPLIGLAVWWRLISRLPQEADAMGLVVEEMVAEWFGGE